MEPKNIPPRPIPPRPPVPPRANTQVGVEKVEEVGKKEDVKIKNQPKKPIDPAKKEADANKKRMAISIAGTIFCFAAAAACVVMLIMF